MPGSEARGCQSRNQKEKQPMPTCSVSRLEWSGVPSTFACTWCMYFYIQIRMCIPMCVGMPASVSPFPSSRLCTLHKHFQPPRSALLPIPSFWCPSRLLEWAWLFPFSSSGDQGWGNEMTVLCNLWPWLCRVGRVWSRGQQVPVLVSDLSHTCWVTLLRAWPPPLGSSVSSTEKWGYCLKSEFLNVNMWPGRK